MKFPEVTSAIDLAHKAREHEQATHKITDHTLAGVDPRRTGVLTTNDLLTKFYL